MKGKIVEANYFYKEKPTAILHGFFAVNMEECPGFVDNYITYYFEDDAELDSACEDNAFDKFEFKIVDLI